MPFPYFDYLLWQFEQGNQSLETSFGHHVHWGYWPTKTPVEKGTDAFFKAAEALTHKMCIEAELADGQHILDVGCGFGGTLAYINSQLNNAFLTGLNIDARQLIRASEKKQDHPSNDTHFIQGDACALPFENSLFDRLLAVECIFHFPSRERFFEQACRVLKPGGILVISDFLMPKSIALTGKITTLQWAKKGYLYGQCDVSYSLQDYEKLAAKQGLTMSYLNINQNVMPTYPHLISLMKSCQVPKRYFLQRLMALWCVYWQWFCSKCQFLQYTILKFEKKRSQA